jgi:hypothetical protein
MRPSFFDHELVMTSIEPTCKANQLPSATGGWCDAHHQLLIRAPVDYEPRSGKRSGRQTAGQTPISRSPTQSPPHPRRALSSPPPAAGH